MTDAKAQDAPSNSGEVDTCIAASDDGQKSRDDGHYLRARASFITCAHEACPAQIRSDCLQWLDDVDKKTPTVVLSARDSGNDVVDVKVTVDGVPLVDHLDGRPIPLDPGEHRFRYTHGSYAPVEDVVVLTAGEKNRPISAKFGTEPVAVRPGPPPLAFVLSGVALVGIGVFAAFGVAGMNEIADCRDQGGACDKSSHQTKTVTDFVIGDSSLVVGLAAGTVAAWLFLKHRDPVMQERVTAAVIPTSHGGAASFSIRF
ncbi:MAG: hypothetical protein ACRELY_24470 [Polyangiaceae bacterium]